VQVLLKIGTARPGLDGALPMRIGGGERLTLRIDTSHMWMGQLKLEREWEVGDWGLGLSSNL
jgi:hypothetical protein